MSSIAEFKSVIGKDVPDWAPGDLVKASESGLRIDDVSALEEICRRGSDDLKKIYAPAMYSGMMSEALSAVKSSIDAFSKSKDRAALISDLEASSSGGVFKRIASELALISMFSDYDSKGKYGSAIGADLSEVEKMAEQIPPDAGWYSEAKGIADFVYPIRSKWYYRYGEDPMPKQASDAMAAYQAKMDAFSLFINVEEPKRTGEGYIVFPDPDKALKDMGIIDLGEIMGENKNNPRKEGA